MNIERDLGETQVSFAIKEKTEERIGSEATETKKDIGY